jgi:hypothetical protein
VEDGERSVLIRRIQLCDEDHRIQQFTGLCDEGGVQQVAGVAVEMDQPLDDPPDRLALMTVSRRAEQGGTVTQNAPPQFEPLPGLGRTTDGKTGLLLKMPDKA